MEEVTSSKHHQCNVCRKSFKYKSNLVIHERIHTGEKPYKCDVCDKAFSQSSSLNKHKRTHAGEKLHKCDECGEIFNKSVQLHVHRRIFRGSKSYICKKCGKYFNCRKHEQSCNYKLSSQTFDFVDCGETIKLEIKQETDANLNDPIRVESELETESIDCKETIKLEIKDEKQDIISTEDIKQELSSTADQFKIENID